MRSPSISLKALREGEGVTQVELAERMGKTQSEISRLEARGDLLVSTLRAYLSALGGELVFTVTFPPSPEPSDRVGQ